MIYRVLQKNIDRLDCGQQAKAMLGDALGHTCLLRAPKPLDLVFVDPPYTLMHDLQSRRRVLDQIARCRAIMGDRGFVVLRGPLDPDTVDVSIEGFSGPEALHRQKCCILPHIVQ